VTRAEASKIIATIAAHYPTTKLTETIVAMWEMRLVAFPRDLANRAALSVCLKTKFFPSLAEIVEEIVALHLELPSVEEAWAMACASDGLSDSSWPKELKAAVRAIGGEGTFRTAHDRLSLRFAFMPAYEGILQARRRESIEEELPAIAQAEGGDATLKLRDRSARPALPPAKPVGHEPVVDLGARFVPVRKKGKPRA
jgi:hypothetical protein